MRNAKSKKSLNLVTAQSIEGVKLKLACVGEWEEHGYFKLS